MIGVNWRISGRESCYEHTQIHNLGDSLPYLNAVVTLHTETLQCVHAWSMSESLNRLLNNLFIQNH